MCLGQGQESCQKEDLPKDPALLSGKKGWQGASITVCEGSQGHTSPPQPCNQQWAWQTWAWRMWAWRTWAWWTWAEPPLGLHPPRPHTDPRPRSPPAVHLSRHLGRSRARLKVATPAPPSEGRESRAQTGSALSFPLQDSQGWCVEGTTPWASALSTTNADPPAGFFSGFETGTQGP